MAKENQPDFRRARRKKGNDLAPNTAEGQDHNSNEKKNTGRNNNA